MDTKELRAIAQDAHDNDNEWFDVQYLNRFVHFDRAEFIAALSPARVLRMIDAIEKLEEATEALEGGLWDYGPGQDEHEKCDEVISRCRASLQALQDGE